VARRHLTGVLLVGGASTRFGLPKALARLDGETLAERAWRVLGACDERIAVGKEADRLELPFSVLDDGTELRAALAGIVAGLRAATNPVAVFLPVDLPLATRELIRRLGEACDEAATTATGPLPAAIARAELPVLERRLHENELRLRDAFEELNTRVVEADPGELVNVNQPQDLEALARDGL
jgi:molybdopterin-guanine dinucleotide biosynthesis protein A